MTPKARSTGQRPNLAAWLSSRTEEQVIELFRLRPDLAAPAPADTHVLAARIVQRGSVGRFADTLGVAHFGILAALLAGDPPVSRTELTKRVARRLPKAAVDELLADLQAAAVVFGDASALEVVPTIAEFFPWPLDAQHLAPLPDPLQPALDALPDDERAIVTTLSNSSGRGQTQDAAADAPAERPVPRLLAKGLLTRLDEQTVALPVQVWNLLHRLPVYDPDSLTPPELTGEHHTHADVDDAAAGEALEFLRDADDVLSTLGRTPAQVLRAGGIGSRELKRLTKATGLEHDRLTLALEVLAAANLVSSALLADATANSLFDDPTGSADELVFGPTTLVDTWREGAPATRWASLARAWLHLASLPERVGTADAAGKTINALSVESLGSGVATERRRLLDTLALAPVGTAVAAETLQARVGWEHPVAARRFGREFVDAVLAQAQQLGVVGRGALSTPGRALLDEAAASGADAATAMAKALPAPIDFFLVQADLTILAPGPLVPEVAEPLGLAAELESAGAASMYRVTEDSLRRAFDAGMSAAELHALFGGHSQTEIPQSLTYLVDDAARRHGRLRAGVASSFLRSDDPALLTEVLAHPVAEQLGLRGIAPTVAITVAPLRDLITELRAAGFSPAGEDAAGGVLDLRPRGLRLPPRSVRKPRTPGLSSDDALGEIVRRMRAADEAAAAVGGNGRFAGTRDADANFALLTQAARSGQRVVVSSVDAAGIASSRIVEPVSVGGGQLEAYDPTERGIRRFTLHRIISVRPV